MIKSFEHKGIELFFQTGNTKGIQPNHAEKLTLILAILHNANIVKDINFPGSDLHKLQGSKKNLWSIKVNGNWRITFTFEKENVYILNYLDYH